MPSWFTNSHFVEVIPPFDVVTPLKGILRLQSREYLKSKREQRLPCILEREDVFRLLGCINTFHNSAFAMYQKSAAWLLNMVRIIH